MGIFCSISQILQFGCKYNIFFYFYEKKVKKITKEIEIAKGKQKVKPFLALSQKS
jgi:hypothetical protein